MFFRFLKTVLLFVFVLVFALPNFSVFAKEFSNNLEEICESMEKVEEICDKLSPTECRQVLEECEQFLEEKSIQIEKEIAKTAEEKKTLSNKISLLKKTIEELSYKINQNSLSIKDLELQIKDTQNSVNRTSLKIEDSKSQLKFFLREIYEKEKCSYLEIILSRNSFSDFFDEIFYLETLSIKLQRILKNIKELRNYLQGQKEVMDEEKEDTEKLVKIQALQTAESEKVKKEEELLLKFTEAEYQKYLKEKETTQKKVTEIRSRIFELIGMPEAPTFGEAYEIAKYVSGIIGVRPAFLLAVLQQESAIGKNVGQCYLRNTATGQGINIKSGSVLSRVMSPTRDVPPFLQITKDLGRDPFNTPVSCPMSYGWGGAMGPAQFIPSTWMLYKDRLQGIIGKPADPWNIRDAFLASGLYLSDSGAKSQTRNGEWRAAMIYFSGSTTNSDFFWYADEVLRKADGFQADIAMLESNR